MPGSVKPSKDSFGRAAGTTATLTPHLLATTGLSSAATPPGFVTNSGLDRGHLVGGQLGGPGSADNVVPLDASTNKGEMKTKENATVKAVLAGNLIRYNVTPQYGERFRITNNRLTRRDLIFKDPSTSEAMLPSPIPTFVSIGISFIDKENLDLLQTNPVNVKKRLEKRSLTPEDTIPASGGVSNPVAEETKIEATIELARRRGEIKRL